MRPHSIIRTLAVTALLALPSIAMAAPDQNTNNNGCPNGQWRNGNGQCVSNGSWNNGNNGNGRWNDRDRREREERERREREERYRREHQGQYNNGSYNGGYNNGGYNNGNYGGYNNGGYNNGGYNNGGYNGNYGNRGGQLNGQVSSFSPYNLYLSNGTHVELHNGTVINPTGTNLTSGQRVRVIGNWNQDGTFNANEIDVVGNGSYGNYRR